MPALPPLLRSCSRLLRRTLLAAVVLAGSWPVLADNADLPEWTPTTPPLEGAELARLEAALQQLPAQRPGVTDLYVLGVAGDAGEDVFGNEVLYLQQLAAQRWHTGGRTLGLINAPPGSAAAGTAPQATFESLGYALDGLGQTLDPAEDVLLIYLTSHGLPDNSFYLRTGPEQEDYLAPADLAQLLDEAKIGNAVIVVSACFSGGFVPTLKAPNRMIITAAREDRPSFGCGNTDSATWFGRAFLVEALNATDDFSAAFAQARATVKRRERQEGELPSHPQIATGRHIEAVLARWRQQLPPPVVVPYPFAAPAAAMEPADDSPLPVPAAAPGG